MMKPLPLLLCTAGLLMGSLNVHAGSVTISTVSGRQFATKEGTVLPAGCAVRIGTFTLPNATRDAKLQSTGDYAQLKAWFKPLAENVAGAGTSQQANSSGTLLRANGFPAAGDTFGVISGITTGYLAPGTQLYVWVFDNAVPDQASQWGIYTLSAWQAPQSLGSEVLATTGSVQALQGTVSGDQLRLVTPPSTYGNWTWKAYAANAPASLAGANVDPDGDGIANLAEYAWGLNPNAADTPRTNIDATGKKFTFKSPRNLTDVALTAECSPDLATWTTVPATVTASDAAFDTLSADAPSGPRCFWRVRFTAVVQP